MKLHYLASPYTLYPHGMDAAYRLACENAALLIKVGYAVFSPIAHGEGLVWHGGLDATDHDLWMRIDEPFMQKCDALVMLEADGWQNSKGMKREYEFFHAAGKPVFWMAPGVPELYEEPIY